MSIVANLPITAVEGHYQLAGGAGFPIEPPRGHMRVERRLKEWDELLKLVEGQAGQIQELRGTGLHVGKLSTPQRDASFSLKVQYTINRDKLK